MNLVLLALELHLVPQLYEPAIELADEEQQALAGQLLRIHGDDAGHRGIR